MWNWLPSVPAGSVVVVESKQDYICDAKVLILSYDLLQRRAEEPPVKNCKVIIMVRFLSNCLSTFHPEIRS